MSTAELLLLVMALVCASYALHLRGALGRARTEAATARRVLLGTSAHAQTELMLRERALASSTNGIMIVDMRLKDTPFTYVNPAFEKITGYSADEVLGCNPRLLQRRDTNQPGLTGLRLAIKARQSCHVRLRNYRKNGSMYWNDLSIDPVIEPGGQLTHYIGVQTDISERIGAEDAVRTRTERLNAVFDLSPDGFVVLDNEAFVSIVNPAFERLTGLKASTLVGRHRTVLEEMLARRCRPEIPDALRKPAFVDTQPVEMGNPDPSSGNELLYLADPQPRTLLRRTRRGREQMPETVLYYRDITRELEIDRMKSEFLSTAAHELRTPMTSIFGFAELLLRRRFDEPRRNEIVGTIHRQAGLLVNLVNELLDLARIEARQGKDFHRQMQPLLPIIESAVDTLMLRDEARPVTLCPRAVPVVVNVDRAKLVLALTNVLSNAYKYSPEGGRISIDLLERERDARPEVGVRVSDEGIGMTPEQVQRIFERFFRADASGSIPGTGLGMSIAKEIVELQGGQIDVASRPDAGTRVTIWLPASRDHVG